MAELMGVSFATVNRWENGQSKPSRLAWQQILRAERYGLDALNNDFEPPMSIREPAASYETGPKKQDLPDFTTLPEIVRLVAESHRLKILYHTRESQFMSICCRNLAYGSSWQMMQGPEKQSWRVFIFVRCSHDDYYAVL